jgi:hypothetical protein
MLFAAQLFFIAQRDVNLPQSAAFTFAGLIVVVESPAGDERAISSQSTAILFIKQFHSFSLQHLLFALRNTTTHRVQMCGET